MKKTLCTFKCNILRRIFGPEKDQGQLLMRLYNFESYKLFKEHDIVAHIRIQRLRWAGLLIRIQKTTSPGSLLFDNQQAVKVEADWGLDGWKGVEEDWVLGVWRWRAVARDWTEWQLFLKLAQAQTGKSYQRWFIALHSGINLKLLFHYKHGRRLSSNACTYLLDLLLI